MYKKIVLVTGGTGLLGSYLLRYLVQKGKVHIRALKRSGSSMDLVKEVASAIEWVEGDILDIIQLEDAMQGVQQVYHCAGKVAFGRKETEELRQINVTGTSNVVNTALYVGIEKMVYVSSIAAIGRSKKQNQISERSKWERSKFNSEYAISKFLAEQEVWRGIAEGLNAVIINPSVILGGGFWKKNTCRLFSRIWEGLRFYPIGSTGFVDVRDVARMMVQLMESNISNERFIANGENLSYLSFFTAVAEAIGTSPPRWAAKPYLTQIAWRAEWLKSVLTSRSALITRASTNVIMEKFYYDHSKSLETLNFRYTPIKQTILDIGHQFIQAQEKGLKSLVLALN